MKLADVKRKVLALELPPQDYAVFGSAPLLAHGLVEGIDDIDVLARGSAWTRATSLGEVETAPEGDKVIRLADGVDIFDGWLGMDKDVVIDRAVVIDELPYADLRDVLAFKRKLERSKDKEHVRLLEAYLF